jgi:hypothetical protein
MTHEKVSKFGQPDGNESIPNKKLEQELRARSKDNRIACAQMFAIAEKLGIPRKEVGDAATQLKIKISNCQLGCF